MITDDQLKPGLLVWWTSYHGFNSTSCPAVITEVSNGQVTVISLASFVKMTSSTFSLDEDSVLLDMEICSKEKIRNFFEDCLVKSQTRLVRQAAAHHRLKTNIVLFTEKHLDE